VYEDQIRSIEGKGTTAPGQIDFALLTDGLRAEREQGITIDVAYRYFSTSRRKFIIADTPGHEQYTRNMATGACHCGRGGGADRCDKGVLPQSRRHAYIASLLRVGMWWLRSTRWIWPATAKMCSRLSSRTSAMCWRRLRRTLDGGEYIVYSGECAGRG